MWRTAHIGQRRFDTYVFRILLLLFWHNNAPSTIDSVFFSLSTMEGHGIARGLRYSAGSFWGMRDMILAMCLLM